MHVFTKTLKKRDNWFINNAAVKTQGWDRVEQETRQNDGKRYKQRKLTTQRFSVNNCAQMDASQL